jgi:hypothetical protein
MMMIIIIIIIIRIRITTARICISYVMKLTSPMYLLLLLLLLLLLVVVVVVVVAESVWRLAAGWTIEGSEFESRYSQIFPLLHIIQTRSGVHAASYPVGTETLSPVLRRPGREAAHSPPTST